MDATQKTETSETLATKIAAKARETAKSFVEEFGEPLDPASTDWDATAWQDDRREFNLTEEQADHFWPLYQVALVFETECLCRDN